MEQRVSLITLGTADMDASAALYDALGWRRVDSPDGVIAYDLIGQTLGLYPLDKLAHDMGLPVAALGQGAITLAHNLRDRDQVDVLMGQAAQAGAQILKPAQEVFWGGYHGYFRAPEGTIWEIAHNPFSPLAADGAFRWLGYD